MNSFIEKNKKFLKFYYAALRLSGWFLLTLGLGGYGITLLIVQNLGVKAMGIASLNMPISSLDFIFFGLLGLGIAQLIRYLFDENCKSGFILKHGAKFLYAYVILMFAIMALRILFTSGYMKSSDFQNAQSLFVVTSIASIILFAAKTLILIGLAQFLKRITPIIEEHKSLV